MPSFVIFRNRGAVLSVRALQSKPTQMDRMAGNARNYAGIDVVIFCLQRLLFFRRIVWKDAAVSM